jgi:hypothetical protein
MTLVPELLTTLRGLSRLLVVAACLGVASAGLADKSPADWETFCRVSTAMERQLAAVKAPHDREIAWRRAVAETQAWGRGFTSSFRFAMTATDPALRYRLLREGAKEEGVPGWTCPAVERLLESVTGASREPPRIDAGTRQLDAGPPSGKAADEKRPSSLP